MNRTTILIFFFNIQFYPHRLVGFPTKPKKILGPRINTPNFRALKFFREGSNDMAR